jgi:hypothetical protein
MKLKQGVNLDISDEIVNILPVVNAIYKAHDKELVITSAKDSVHSKNSKHYWTLNDTRPADAIDIRTNYFPTVQVIGIVAELKKQLGNNYDVIFEKNHIHIEFDKK